MRVLMLGDIFGKPGRKVTAEFLPQLQAEYEPDLIIANGENAAGGFGLTKKVAEELFSLGIHVLTSGNHIWDQKEMVTYIATEPRVLRPRTILRGCRGKGLRPGRKVTGGGQPQWASIHGWIRLPLSHYGQHS